MDERLWICLWMVGGGVLGGVLGAAFGALTGVVYAQNGGAAGTGLARRIVEPFLDTPEQQASSLRRAALIGAADGFLFLGIFGLVAGALLGVSGRATNELLVPAVVGSVFLVGGAAFFGGLAYGLARNGPWAAVWVFAVGLLGTFLAGLHLGADNCLFGTIPGLLVGLILSFLQARYAPRFQPPRVEKPAARHRSDTDITGPPHARPGSDAIRKPDAEEEEE